MPVQKSNILLQIAFAFCFIGCGQWTDNAPTTVPPSGRSDTTRKLVTFNIRYGTADDGPDRWDCRKDAVFSILTEYQADVIALQEALDFQVDQIQRALPNYDSVFVCRDDGKRAGESCPIFYRQDRFEYLEAGTFWFSDTPDVPGSKHWGNQIPRICTWISLHDRSSGRPVWIFNVHLDHQSQISREKSIRLLAQRIEQLPPDSQVILMGDFNMELSNPAMQPLWAERGPHLTDAWHRLYPDRESPGTWHDFGRRFNTARIDHILIPMEASVRQADIDQRQFEGRYPSDHFPVWAVVEWDPRAARTE